MIIPFNKPYLTGNEVDYIRDAAARGKLSGNGHYTQLCQNYFEKKYGFGKCLLTTSCTDALEMCAMLLDIQPGDEIIIPSYTFVSTALAFDREGAVIRFVDSRADHPGMNESEIESLINPRTKAILVVHYAGVACDMFKIMDIAHRHNLYIIEDAAHALDGWFTNEKGVKMALGSIGHLAAFSFHETKNIQCGEGGMLVVNHKAFFERAEVLWEKGTDRTSFFRGERNYYTWRDKGSSFLPSEISAAFLWAQIENLDDIQKRRLQLWNTYYEILSTDAHTSTYTLPKSVSFAHNNAHIFYLLLTTQSSRDEIIQYLNSLGVWVVFHYICLHTSPYYHLKHDHRVLPHAMRYMATLIRLPLYYELKFSDIIFICKHIKACQK
ncbi:MAG TPA: dTDP-4-amino-4,6-dideoxygalactose transaminase [Saprospiraceae bacterium]|nr:dTDP-4-amino-4,6-dideoxygalactose transaminase [Saprospiraceae bacterium]